MTPSSSNVAKTRRRGLPVSIMITAVLWALITLAIFPLSQGTLPFHIKLFDERGTPFLGRILILEGSLVEALVIMGLAYLITAQRPVPDMAARAPDVSVARIETLLMVGFILLLDALQADFDARQTHLFHLDVLLNFCLFKQEHPTQFCKREVMIEQRGNLLQGEPQILECLQATVLSRL
jgi:hypothetical protein